MKTSFATLIADEETFGVAPMSDAPASGTSHSAQRDLPANIYAATAREAGRLNAAQIKRTELETLLSERQRLLDKKFDGTMTKSESNRLEYIRWSLDRIDDARRGIELEALGAFVSKLEGFRDSVNQLHKDLTRAAGNLKKR
ncbi:hypothetical protein [Bradyrhizobium sp. ORS 285]|uniref:hypothetical protein n=1 Tax=Bradyrhizobium sp. ORS 285 TaxID=115808 RepID=UPI0002407367|nr:hypothetical protein [Bradyrhizobium sp. ORS 285]CCD87905.1 hypothetical protein BRAO285_2650030 [Bradyrhizobium sp. ORS 285]